MIQPDWQTSDGSIRLYNADCLDVLPLSELADSCVTDPPYHLTTGKKGGSGPASVNLNSPQGRARIGAGFMGKAWDGGDVAFRPETWVKVLDSLKPGAHLLAFGGTRTYHRLACAIEDAGFEIRDCIMWIFGSGFPKSLDVSKAIDKAAGVPIVTRGHIGWTRADAENVTAGAYRTNEERQKPGALAHEPVTTTARQWSGWGTSLKPAYEPIIVARKPLVGTVAANVLQHGAGALNIDGCRVDADARPLRVKVGSQPAVNCYGDGHNGSRAAGETDLGRWPANVILNEEAGASLDKQSGVLASGDNCVRSKVGSFLEHGGLGRAGDLQTTYGDTGGASRFFYCAKADSNERRDSKHPTIKPLALIEYLVRLVTPPGGLVLDPFLGSGTTMEAAYLGNWLGIGIEGESAYLPDAIARIESRRPTLFEKPPQIVQRSLIQEDVA